MERLIHQLELNTEMTLDVIMSNTGQRTKRPVDTYRIISMNPPWVLIDLRPVLDSGEDFVDTADGETYIVQASR